MEFINKINKKYLIIMLLVLLIFSIILITIKKDNSMEVNTNYTKINGLINNKETFIIYFYNSRSSNKYNKKVKNYLDDNSINYYIYDDSEINKEEYNNFLKLLNIDPSLFGNPAIIYIKDGEMYSNLININNIDSLKQYIEDYDLTTIKK